MKYLAQFPLDDDSPVFVEIDDTDDASGPHRVGRGDDGIAKAEQALRDALAKIGGIGLSGGKIAISPNNQWLVTGSGDGTARLWDLSATDPAAAPLVLRGHEGGITTVAFSPDAQRLVTGSWDDSARLWTLHVEKLIDLACRTAGRNLSLNEWDQYFRGEVYRQTCPNLPVHWSVSQSIR
jgi:WD40 repeat protein